MQRKKPGPLAGPRRIVSGAPWGIRTLDHRIRSPVLYPAELMAQNVDRSADAKIIVESCLSAALREIHDTHDRNSLVCHR